MKPIYVMIYKRVRQNPENEFWRVRIVDRVFQVKGSMYEKTSKFRTPLRGTIKSTIEDEDLPLKIDTEYTLEEIYDLHFRKIVIYQAYEENPQTGKVEWVKSGIGKTFIENWEGLINEATD